MPPITTIKRLDFARALAHVDAGAVFVDLRPLDSYLEVHIPGSLALIYEFGPGMAGRARDCLPLHLGLVLLERDDIDMRNVTGALRGKGFEVAGTVADGINGWARARGAPTSTDVVRPGEQPEGLLLDVGDSGASHQGGARRVPVELLWDRAGEFAGKGPVVVTAGYGVRAALAVGMLERAGVQEVLLFKTRRDTLLGARSGRHGHPAIM